MHKQLLIGFTFLFLLTITSAPVLGQSREELQQKYVAFLSKKDIFSKIDSDGDVQFQYDEKTFYIEVNEYDTGFFRIVCANIWSIDDEAERIEVLRAIDLVNRQSKVIKMYTNDDNVWIGAELFCASVDDYEVYFDRCLRIINEGIGTFVSEM